MYIYANFPKLQSYVSSKVKAAIKNTNTIEGNEMLIGKLNIKEK